MCVLFFGSDTDMLEKDFRVFLVFRSPKSVCFPRKFFNSHTECLEELVWCPGDPFTLRNRESLEPSSGSISS